MTITIIIMTIIKTIIIMTITTVMTRTIIVVFLAHGGGLLRPPGKCDALTDQAFSSAKPVSTCTEYGVCLVAS